MIFGTAMTLEDRAKFAEGSALASSRDDRNNSLLWKKVRTAANQQHASVGQVQKVSREVAKLRRRIVGGGSGPSGWFFGTKIELPAAPYPSFAAQQVIHIQATNGIVSTGIRDAANPSGPVLTSCPGLWVATQSVPGQSTVGGNPVWNLPQYPMPVPTNYDDPTNFWIYLGELSC
jgi:hypothetical protein